MWLAACSEQACQWRVLTASLPLAEFHFRRHVLETGHQGIVVAVPILESERSTELGVGHPTGR